MLWGFPGEPHNEYVRMANLIPLLTHLQPPKVGAAMRLDRFSPAFDSASELGFTDVKPYPSYFYIYPFQSDVVANLANAFTFGYQRQQDVAGYTGPIQAQITAWRVAYETSDLFSIDKGAHLLIWDLRPVARRPLTTLAGLQRFLYIACDQIQTLRSLGKLLQEQAGKPLAEAEIEALLEPLMKDGLMIREGNAFLALTIPIGEYSPSSRVMERFLTMVETMGTPTEGGIVIPLSSEVEEEVITMT